MLACRRVIATALSVLSVAGCSRAGLLDWATDTGPAPAANAGTGGGPPPTGPAPTPVHEQPVSNDCSLRCAGETPDGLPFSLEVATEFDGFPWRYCEVDGEVRAGGFATCGAALGPACWVQHTLRSEQPIRVDVTFYFGPDGVDVSVETYDTVSGREDVWTETIPYDRCEASELALQALAERR